MLNDIGVTPQALVDAANKDVEGTIAAINRRIDVLEVQMQDAQRTKVPPGRRVDVPHAKVPAERKWYRIDVLGATPSKDSPIGRAVIARMRTSKRIKGPPGQEMVLHEEKWYPIAECDMGHTTDAVTWWNKEGMFYGPKSPQVRAWMRRSEIYELEPGHINSSRGAQIGEEYVAPNPYPITEQELNSAKPASPNGKTGPAKADLQAFRSEAEQHAREAAALKQDHAALEKEMAGLKKQASNSRQALGNGTMDQDAFMSERKAIDSKTAALEKRRAALVERSKTLHAKAESIVERFSKEMPAEVEAAYGTRVPREVLIRGQFSRGVATLGTMVGIVTFVALAYSVAVGIREVIEAEGAVAKVGKALEVGAPLAAGIGMQILAAHLAKSNAIGLVVSVAVSMPTDNSREADYRAKVAEKNARDKQMQHEEALVVGKLLEEVAPGSVVWVENQYLIKDQALWDKTVEDVREAQADLRAKALATLLKRAYDLGADDGAAGRDFLRADEIKDWKEVEESPDPDVAFSKLFEPYKTGFRKANSRQQKLFARVSEAGYADGKAGRRRDPAALVTPHEIQALVSSGINLPRFMSAVESDYADGYKKGRGGTARNEALKAAHRSFAQRLATSPRHLNSRSQTLQLDDLLVRSSVVSLHAPLAPDTRHLINAERLFGAGGRGRTRRRTDRGKDRWSRPSTSRTPSRPQRQRSVSVAVPWPTCPTCCSRRTSPSRRSRRCSMSVRGLGTTPRRC